MFFPAVPGKYKRGCPRIIRQDHSGTALILIVSGILFGCGGVRFRIRVDSNVLYLADAGICASSGSACTSGSLDPSHVLKAMDVPFTSLHGSLRFSLSRYSTDADVDAVLEAMPGIVRTLRDLSPFGR